VVELAGTLSVAAGAPSHDLASIMRELGADVESCRLAEGQASMVGDIVAAHPGCRPVVVVRDVDRHPWQQVAAAAILAADTRSVVVDVGYPTQDSLTRGGGRITTFGAGRASFVAAAERLLADPGVAVDPRS
jgi:beta-N-acetylhexosaminidase